MSEGPMMILSIPVYKEIMAEAYRLREVDKELAETKAFARKMARFVSSRDYEDPEWHKFFSAASLAAMAKKWLEENPE